MAQDVDLEHLRRLGSQDQILVRKPSDSLGAEWADSDAFSKKQRVACAFGSGPPATVVVQVTCPDGQVVAASSIIHLSVSVADGRDSDELEMDPVVVSLGEVTNSVSAIAVVSPASRDSQPHGNYVVHYARL